MKMAKVILVLCIAAMSSACVVRAPASSLCPDVKTRKITISYTENSQIKIRPAMRHIEQGEALRFRLKGADGTKITVSGKSDNDKWIATTATGSRRGNSSFVCVVINQPATDYRYTVEVDGIGLIDPVVRVKTRGGGR